MITQNNIWQLSRNAHHCKNCVNGNRFSDQYIRQKLLRTLTQMMLLQASSINIHFWCAWLNSSMSQENLLRDALLSQRAGGEAHQAWMFRTKQHLQVMFELGIGVQKWIWVLTLILRWRRLPNTTCLSKHIYETMKSGDFQSWLLWGLGSICPIYFSILLLLTNVDFLPFCCLKRSSFLLCSHHKAALVFIHQMYSMHHKDKKLDQCCGHAFISWVSVPGMSLNRNRNRHFGKQCMCQIKPILSAYVCRTCKGAVCRQRLLVLQAQQQ